MNLSAFACMTICHVEYVPCTIQCSQASGPLLHPGCRLVHSHFSHTCQRRTTDLHRASQRALMSAWGGDHFLFYFFFPFVLFCRTHGSLKSQLFRETLKNPEPLRQFDFYLFLLFFESLLPLSACFLQFD